MNLFFEKTGAGPALLMTHGIFGAHDNLGAIARILAEHFTLYLIDLRNHGRSPHADTMSYSEMAADVVELLDAANLETAALFGHSLGGKVMMEVALSYPERVSKLVVGDIAPVEYPSHHNPVLDGLQAVKLGHINSRNDADAQMQPFIEEKFVRQYLLKSLARDQGGHFYWRFNLKALVTRYDDLRGVPGPGKTFEKPTLFIRGENSNYIREQSFPQIHAKFPRAQIETIANTGHWLHGEKPQRFAELMIGFLAP